MSHQPWEFSCLWSFHILQGFVSQTNNSFLHPSSPRGMSECILNRDCLWFSNFLCRKVDCKHNMHIITSDIQIFNFLYQSSGHPVFVWARMWRSLLFFKAGRDPRAKTFGNTALMQYMRCSQQWRFVLYYRLWHQQSGVWALVLQRNILLHLITHTNTCIYIYIYI